jgi:hypothetical protein
MVRLRWGRESLKSASAARLKPCPPGWLCLPVLLRSPTSRKKRETWGTRKLGHPARSRLPELFVASLDRAGEGILRHAQDGLSITPDHSQANGPASLGKRIIKKCECGTAKAVPSRLALSRGFAPITHVSQKARDMGHPQTRAPGSVETPRAVRASLDRAGEGILRHAQGRLCSYVCLAWQSSGIGLPETQVHAYSGQALDHAREDNHEGSAMRRG